MRPRGSYTPTGTPKKVELAPFFAMIVAPPTKYFRLPSSIDPRIRKEYNIISCNGGFITRGYMGRNDEANKERLKRPV